MNLKGLQTIFTHEMPFGPTNATNILADKKVVNRLLDPHNKIPDPAKSQRVMGAMLQMDKLDIQGLLNAAQG